MRLKLLFVFLIITNIIWANTEIAAPANDNFADAIPVSCGNNYTASTLEATIDEDNAPDSTNPVVDLDASNIWYSYTGTGIPEIVTLDLCASGYDTAYLVYTGTSGNLSLVDANDDNETQCGPGYRSYGTFQSDGTTTYYITITGFGPSDTGTVDLTVSCLPADAILIPDANFEQALIDLSIDTGIVNGYISPVGIDQINDLNISNKNISDLSGIENFTGLQSLNVSNNNLTGLPLTANTNITSLNCSFNNISFINLTNQSSLTSLQCNNNDGLSTLFVNNGNNTNITLFDAGNNADLTCIQVDNEAYSLTNWTNIDVNVQFSEMCNQTTYVPDDNFEQALIDLGYDTTLDDYVATANINTVRSLTVSSRNITDLTGIEGFTALTFLSCSNNMLPTIDVTNNSMLEYFYCKNNQLTTIDVSQNPVLDTFWCYENSLTSVDLTQNSNLRSFLCFDNELTSVDVTQNLSLRSIAFGENPIEHVDLSNNSDLISINATGATLLSTLDLRNGNNVNINFNLAGFDVTNTPNLSCVDVDDAAYSTANWTSIDPGLTFSENCNAAPIPPNDECVDAIAVPISDGTCNNTVAGTLAGATGSSVFQCSGESPAFSDVWYSFLATETTHNISILNTSGANSGVFHAVIDAQTYNCGNITDAVYCTDATEGEATGLTIGNTYFIQVYSYTSGITETFDICVSTNTIPGQTYVPDDNFEQALIDLGYDTALDDYVTTTNINTVEILSIDNRSIADLTGIEDFAALEQLYVGDNPLGSLNLTQNPALELLNANNTSLATIDLTQNTALQYLSIESNQLATISITQNTALISASFQSNQLATIDVSQNLVLETLNLVQNLQFGVIDVSTNTSLKTLNLNFTQVLSIDITNNPNLESFLCFDCPLRAIDVSANPALKTLSVGGTQVPFVDISNNPAIENLFASSCGALTGINAQNGNNTNVQSFLANNIPNLTCIQVDDVAYSTANWTNVDGGTNFSADCGFLENDECVNAIDIPISNATCNNVVSATMVGATDSNSLHCFGDNANFADMWFSFTATETTHKIALQNLTGSPNFLWHALIDAQTYTCGNITDSIYCTDGLENTATGLTIGNTYYIQVYSHVANANTTFDICVSTNSIPGLTYVPDNNFEQALIDLGYDTTLDDYVTTTNISSINDLNIRNLGIFDLTGIEDFAALEILNCGLNFLGELDLSQNTNLNYLIADNAALVGLNMQNGNNTNVTTFITLGNVDLFCIQVDDAAYSTANWTIIEQTTSFNEYCGDPIQVAAKVYLQGAMLQNTDGFMRTDLKDNNHISDASSPYADGIAASDNVFFALGQDKIVDWIWVELRDANDATIIIDGKSAILQRDGDIVSAEGDASTLVSFSRAPGDYYIVIKHRNHLGIMSNSTFSLSNVVTTVDFTNNNNQITYGTNAQTTFGMPTNTVAMWSGNVNGDTVIQYTGTTPDAPIILSTILNDAGNFLNFPTYVLNGYSSNDINMDGTTQYTGTNPDTPFILQNILAHPGNFLNFSTYQIVEQLPQNE